MNIFERKAIYYRHNSGESYRSIGRLLNRHHTTIMREVKRNKPPYYTYFDESAEDLAAERRKKPRHAKKFANKTLYQDVVHKLLEGWPPDAIAGRLKKTIQMTRENVSVMRQFINGLLKTIKLVVGSIKHYQNVTKREKNKENRGAYEVR